MFHALLSASMANLETPFSTATMRAERPGKVLAHLCCVMFL